MIKTGMRYRRRDTCQHFQRCSVWSPAQ